VRTAARFQSNRQQIVFNLPTSFFSRVNCVKQAPRWLPSPAAVTLYPTSELVHLRHEYNNHNSGFTSWYSLQNQKYAYNPDMQRASGNYYSVTIPFLSASTVEGFGWMSSAAWGRIKRIQEEIERQGLVFSSLEQSTRDARPIKSAPISLILCISNLFT
jgi:hypothetical protein